MKTKLILLWFAAGLLTVLSGCGFVKSLFPDKEKDYQYTSEIPPLVYPKDLAKANMPNFTSADLAAVSAVQPPTVAADSPAVRPEPIALPDAAHKNPVPVKEPLSLKTAMPLSTDNAPTKKTPSKHIPLVAAVVKDGNTQLLRVDGDFDTVWRAVNKALSRKSIEVTERNSAAQTITLRYDDLSQSAGNRNLWQEAIYVLSGMPSTDKVYSLKFSTHGQQTEVAVYNEQQQPVADDSGLSLLNLLQSAI